MKAQPGVKVAILGASPKEDRYSYKAVRLLKQNGFQPIPVHPAGHTVDGIEGLKSLTDISDPIDTLSVYVNSNISNGEKDNILKLKPRRVVFNPGTENSALAAFLKGEGIEVVENCTLVMLNLGIF
ncbi:MAG: CoA-binding protein [bacterium]